LSGTPFRVPTEFEKRIGAPHRPGEDMSAARDVIVVGGGPAGLAAAIRARSLGLSTTLVDENGSLGGPVCDAAVQAPERTSLDRWWLAHGRYRQLAEATAKSGADMQLDALAWDLTPEGKVAVRQGGKTRQLSARYVVLAIGARERPVPVANWTLPGVLTFGDLQRTLKQGSALPFDRIALAGCGPLLWVAAIQLRRAGVVVEALFTTATFSDLKRTLRDAPKRFRQGRWGTRAAPLPLIRGVTFLEIRGRGQVEAVVARVGSAQTELRTGWVMLHAGLIPDTSASAALGCRHMWDTVQRCWRPHLDPWGQSSHDRIFIAGDSASVGGQVAAELTGTLASLAIAAKLGALSRASRDTLALPLHARLQRKLAQQQLWEGLSRLPPWLSAPGGGDIIVCPCEAVTVAEIRRAVALGATGANQVKAFTRCGMGPCQGRLCGTLVCAIIAEMLQMDAGAITPLRHRSPLRPVTLGELAALGADD